MICETSGALNNHVQSSPGLHTFLCVQRVPAMTMRRASSDLQKEDKLLKQLLLGRQLDENLEVVADEIAGKVQNALKACFLMTERRDSRFLNAEQWLTLTKINLSAGVIKTEAEQPLESLDGNVGSRAEGN